MRCTLLSQNICRILKPDLLWAARHVLLLLVTQGLDQGGEPWPAVPTCQWCQTLQQHPRQLLLQLTAQSKCQGQCGAHLEAQPCVTAVPTRDEIWDET